MICTGLERFFELPIIQAPKRNSKLHSEMWTNSFMPRGIVQKGRFSGNTWDLSAHSERSRAGAGFGESLVAAPGLQFWENRVYPRSSSQ